MLLEICCGNYHDALNAYENGADRIELNSALCLGGLTPSEGTLKLIKEKLKIKTICMVRPRAGGFCYSDGELEECFFQAETMLQNGADGIAFGFLNCDHTIDSVNTARMVALIHSYGKEAVFHRALDLVDDLDVAMQTLIDLKVDRVLTAGLKQNAILGIEEIQAIVHKYGQQIEILAGGGVNIDNVEHLAQQTKVSQVHSSCKQWQIDATASFNACSFGYHKDNDYECADPAKIKALANKCHNEL